MTDNVLTIRNLTKEYPGVRALGGVDLDVAPGEVHCLVGQNGAGKSTLIKCISGAVEPTTGTILIDGQELPAGKPTVALQRGVATMYQELDLIEELSIAENVFLGHEPRLGPLMNKAKMRTDSKALLERLGHGSLNPKRIVSTLRPAEKQLVSLARALSRDARLLIMDEPSAILDPPEIEALFDVIRRLTAEGVGVIYISHRMDEIARIGSRITVLRDGTTVASNLPADTPIGDLIVHMVGRQLEDVFPEREPHGDKVAMQVMDVRVPGTSEEISFDVRAGEILGIAGLVGSGRTELLRAIFGADRRNGGSVIVDGTKVPAGRPDRAIAAGVGFAPEERKSQGLWLEWSQIRNVSVSDLRRFSKGPFVDAGSERQAAAKHLESLHVAPNNPKRRARELSGGNQQKVVLARWLLHDCKVLLLDEPTRGVDAGAKAEVYKVVSELAARGIGIVMVSSELAEVVGFCDRILVMREGALVAELAAKETSEQEILTHALSSEGAA